MTKQPPLPRRAALRGLAAALAPAAVAALLAGCGRAGPPRQPGPREVITYPRPYPAPDPAVLPPAPPVAPPLAAPPPPAPPPAAPASRGR